VVQRRKVEMRDNIEDLIYEILSNNTTEDSARVLYGIINDVESGIDIEYSIDKNCEIILDERY
jgi:hypothetical protein